jgi:Fic family protein
VNRIFKPNFRYTDKIVKNLVDIASAREAVLNSYLVPKWEVSLRKDALIRATHASTAIEGNPLTIEEVSMLAHGRKVTAARKAEQEVLNYLKVLEKIEKYQQKRKITNKSILKLHKDISKDILEKHKRDSKGQVSLTERQMKIIETLQKNGKITAGEVARMVGVTRQAALKELHKLVEPEIIKLEGKGRGAYYIMS